MKRYQIELYGASWELDSWFCNGELGAARIYLDILCQRQSIQAGRIVDTWQGAVVYEW